jgi:hypothetical protein
MGRDVKSYILLFYIKCIEGESKSSNGSTGWNGVQEDIYDLCVPFWVSLSPVYIFE